MEKNEKQLVIVADMEGASGIFESNRQACWHEAMYPKETLWREYGRDCITNDVLAVCNAANDFGIERIFLYDMHFAGCTESNVKIELLPKNVTLADTPDRCMDWKRIRGQAAAEPFGLVTVGQHARNGEPNSYFPHTIHTPPIEAFYCNGVHIAEIGMSVVEFEGVPYLANIGCAASHGEAKELVPTVHCISVKDKAKNWEPTKEETYPLIYNGVMESLKDWQNQKAYAVGDRCRCELELSDGYFFDVQNDFPWKGSFTKRTAIWESCEPESAFSIFWRVHEYIKKEK